MLSCQGKITKCHAYFSHHTSVFVELTEYWNSGFHQSNHLSLPQKIKCVEKNSSLVGHWTCVRLKWAILLTAIKMVKNKNLIWPLRNQKNIWYRALLGGNFYTLEDLIASVFARKKGISDPISVIYPEWKSQKLWLIQNVRPKYWDLSKM